MIFEHEEARRIAEQVQSLSNALAEAQRSNADLVEALKEIGVRCLLGYDHTDIQEIVAAALAKAGVTP